MKKKQPSRLTQSLVFNALEKEYGINLYEQYLEYQISDEILPEILGENICRYVSSVKNTNGTIYIKVNSAPLKANLQLQKTVILSKINKKIGSNIVQHIVFF